MHVQLHHIVSSSMGNLYFKIMHTKHITAHAVSFPDPTNIVLSRRERVSTLEYIKCILGRTGCSMPCDCHDNACMATH